MSYIRQGQLFPWEEFVENIPFSETRHYIRQVISNYNNYRLLYGEHPNAPGSTN